MRRDYYYLVSSLPSLLPGTPPHMTKEKLLAACSTHLKDSDLRLLDSIKLQETDCDYEHPLPVVRQWLQWECSVRNELVRLRGARLGIDPGEYVRIEGDEDRGHGGLARRAFEAASPLDAERMLDDERWRLLDRLEYGHYFDMERLALYWLKFQMLERRAVFDREKGMERVLAIAEKGEGDAAGYVRSWGERQG